MGCGGLGSPSLLYLAAAGVGTLRLIENDVVDRSNLQRQILFSENDLGQPKVEAAAKRLRAQNPHIALDLRAKRLSAANALELLRDVDLVLDGSDNFSTRYVINDACVRLGIPLISASVLRFEGQLGVFHWKGGPCYRCLYPEPPPAGFAPSCAEAGVLGVVPGVLGTLQANEALKILLGIGESLTGRLLCFDLLNGEFNVFAFHRRADCRACGGDPSKVLLEDLAESCDPGLELDVHALKNLLSGPRPPYLLDVREPSEASLCRLENSVLIPLGELERRIDEIPSDREIVVYCKSGVRSARAVETLKARRPSARNLSGGILAWIDRIDPTLQRY